MPRVQRVLSKKDWLEAGQRELRVSGVRGVKLRPLVTSLGVSTGSFYYHFKDFDDYLGKLADFYSGEQLLEGLKTVKQSSQNPEERLEALNGLVNERSLPQLAVAMRAWAQVDARARAAVETLDAIVSAFTIDCYRAMGMSQADAELCCYLLLAANSVDVKRPLSLPHLDDVRAALLAMVSRKAP